MKFRWASANVNESLAAELSHQLRVSRVFAHCLINRGLTDSEAAGRFIDPRLSHLADPFLIPGMEKAVERIWRARESREPIVIFGDYDVDGVSATAILSETLDVLGCAARTYLPDRFEEGYGLSLAAVENCFQRYGAGLVICVDCGSTSSTSVEWLQARGCDVIVLDHHQVCVPAPQPVALVNPQLADAAQPNFRELCSAGLAFKLAHALMKHGRAANTPEAFEFDLRELLDLVALATIADVVPLTGENRILASAGLKRLNQTTRPGLLALMEMAQIQSTIKGYEVGFQLAPRLNAAGRLEDAELALRLLLSREMGEARTIAKKLDDQNRERQRIGKQILDDALGRLKQLESEDFVIVQGQSQWHIGVVGIVASRVLQEFYRPTIIFGGDGAKWRGSGRSIDGFDLAQALRECHDLLLSHGGHAMAAGVSIDPEKLPEFRGRINDVARQQLKAEQLQPTLRLDAQAELSDLSLKSIEELGKLEQTGCGNPPVQLFSSRLSFHRPPKRMGPDQQHAKFWITDGKAVREGVWWNLGADPLPEGCFDLAFAPQANHYNGTSSVQLKALDWRPTASA